MNYLSHLIVHSRPINRIKRYEIVSNLVDNGTGKIVSDSNEHGIGGRVQWDIKPRPPTPLDNADEIKYGAFKSLPGNRSGLLWGWEGNNWELIYSGK